MQNAIMTFSVRPKRVVQTLILIAASLAFISIAGQFSKYFLGKERLGGLINFFDVNAENTIPTLYAGFTLFLSSALLYLIALVKRRRRDRFTNNWRMLSAIFLYLALDELLQIHETVNQRLSESLKLGQNGTWDILNSVLVPIIALLYLKFFLHLPTKTRRLFFTAACLFVLGALGIELAGERYLTTIYNQPVFVAEVIATVEEFLEMAGVTVFIYALLLYINSFLDGINICLAKAVLPMPNQLADQPDGQTNPTTKPTVK